ncbi:MAG: hypothetical protein ACFBSE_11810 [Prochloraceae cyanobacterium]
MYHKRISRINKNKWLCGFWGSLLSLAIAPVSMASAIVEIPFRQALGREGTVPQIAVYPRVGFTVINFREAFMGTDEKVRQITIGDSNSVKISSDDPGCISNFGEYRQASQACSVSVIYVEIDEDVWVDLKKTRLTVLTDNHLFLFDLVLREIGSPKVVYVRPMPANLNHSEQAAVDQIEHLYLGYAAATAKGIISEDLSHRIHHFLYYARAGKPLPQAAAEAGVSMAVVRKLDSLGIAEQVKQKRSIAGDSKDED